MVFPAPLGPAIPRRFARANGEAQIVEDERRSLLVPEADGSGTPISGAGEARADATARSPSPGRPRSRRFEPPPRGSPPPLGTRRRGVGPPRRPRRRRGSGGPEHALEVRPPDPRDREREDGQARRAGQDGSGRRAPTPDERQGPLLPPIAFERATRSPASLPSRPNTSRSARPERSSANRAYRSARDRTMRSAGRCAR